MTLDDGALCVECSEVFDMRERQECPKCGCSTFFRLAKALNPKVLRFESERTIHEMDDWPVAAI